MNQSQLIQHISTFDTLRVVKVRSKLRDHSFSLSELVDLTFYQNKEVAEKASKLLEYIVYKFPQNYCAEYVYLVSRITDVDRDSCKKYYAKILMHLTSPDVPKDVRAAMKEVSLEQAIELCFQWLRDDKMLTRVRASATEALFNMRHRYPWIAESLSKYLETLSPKAAPMLKARANYVLDFLHCED